jgi:dCMP deaminase
MVFLTKILLEDIERISFPKVVRKIPWCYTFVSGEKNQVSMPYWKETELNNSLLSDMSQNMNRGAINKQLALDKRYLKMAKIWSENSYCQRRKVGALIVKDKMIISDGYNGTPSGFENVCEDDDYKTKPYVLHAEANAITKIARSHNNSDGATLYVTASPCIECAKLIIQAGIKRVVYSDKYRLDDGVNLLERANIHVVSIDMES